MFEFLLVVVAVVSVIYLILLNPIVFHFWIIPKIERRYGKNLKIKDEDYPYIILASWMIPPIEISAYILFKLFSQFEPPGIKYPKKNSIYFKLKNMKYDVKNASFSEKVISLVTLSIIFYFFIIGILVTFFWRN